MKSANLLSLKLAGLVVLLTISLQSQGPISDTLIVDFPNQVIVGGERLEAGQYHIRQVPSASNPRILEFSSENGTALEVTVTASPILDNQNVNKSTVVLENRGGTSYLSKIWVEGKSYGYQFAVPDSPPAAAGAKATNQTIQLTATYTPPQAAPQPKPAETAAAKPAPQLPPETKPEPSTTAQARPEELKPEAAPAPATPKTEPEPAPPPTETAAQQPTQPTVADQPEPAAPERLPATATHLGEVLMAGLALLTTGLLIHKFHTTKQKVTN